MYTKSDYSKAHKNDDASRKETGVGDFMMYLNQARRSRINSTPLAKRISREWSGR